ncbi:MAG: M3 family metallopeptidase [Alloprevotella sp.]
MNTFISSQLLSDAEWQHALQQGFQTEDCAETPAVRLRHEILEGMKAEMKEIEQIARNPEPPTFDNTILPLSRTGCELERAATVMYNLQSAETNDELNGMVEEMAPLLAEHSNNIMLNEALFRRVKLVYEQPDENLTAEDRMLLQRTYEGFERSGATLDDAGKEEFRRISRELAEASVRFSNHLLKETNSFMLQIDDEAELEGLPEMHREAAAQEAASHGIGGWVFTLHAPSFIPFMTYSARRSLRETLYRAYHTRCCTAGENNNLPIVERIINLRRQKAQLLGYANYADYTLRRRMAGTPEAVYKLLNQLIEAYRPHARKEVDEVAAFARKAEGAGFELMPWDFAYYSQQIKKARFDYDPDMLRPYFELSQVKEGVFSLATRLYGITFEADREVPVYHPDVTAYRVFDSEHRYLAMLFTDFFPREGKKGGAWMTNYRDEHCDLSSHMQVTPDNSVRPVVSVTMNFTKPAADRPALLTLDEVETFLHEFGHALHGIFAMTHHATLSGTSVYWDFVELPSQFMENYAVQPEFLHTFARHYQTGEPLPQSFIDRIRQVRNFHAAYNCMRQVSFGLLDMACHTITGPISGPLDEFERQAWSAAQLLPAVPETCMLTNFSHIMSGGYAAGYYSYKWAEVLDADAFSLFQQHGIFDRVTADSFREHILSKGGTQPPMELYRQFMHREPTMQALLRRDGLLTGSAGFQPA